MYERVKNSTSQAKGRTSQVSAGVGEEFSVKLLPKVLLMISRALRRAAEKKLFCESARSTAGLIKCLISAIVNIAIPFLWTKIKLKS